MYDTKYFEFIKNSLDQLDKVTIWIFLLLMALVLSDTKSDEFEIGSIKLKKNNSGVVFYIILCALNFQVLKLLQLLSNQYDTIKDKKVAVIIIQNHTWFLNPFSRTSGAIGIITDYIGFPLLIVMWWIGFALANSQIMHIPRSKSSLILIPFLFLFYLLFGVFSLMIIANLLITIGGNKDKILCEIFGVVIGIFFFFLIDKKKKFLNKII